ncbi:MAG: outer membrane protein assembly factor BamE [Burkholderiales bacterium]|nr:outer membrane protein assembly factor BamE [Burkholderiales bacterium]
MLQSTRSFLLALPVAWFLAGCASYSGSGLTPGTSTQADTRTVMGEPAAVHKAPAGAAFAESWEYPKGPLGRHTFMARFDGSGRLIAIDQVLTVNEVAKLKPGEATRDDVRRTLGRPGIITVARNGIESWDYAAHAVDVPMRKIRLIVNFDARGLVSSAGESYDPEEFNPNGGAGTGQN